jgi:hydrogenase maturation protease
MTTPAPDLRILVCGTADRGDDGAALAAISHVLPELPKELQCRIEVRRCRQLDVTDLLDIGPTASCVVIDTVVGVEPGQIVTMSLNDLARRPGGVAPRSAHTLSFGDALLIAEVVRGTLPAGTFVGIGGKWFGYGERYSRVVKAGLPDFVLAIRSAIEDLLPVAPGLD